jgi:hypothetical protein
MEAKMATGAVATSDMSMASGVTQRVMVSVMGEGTRRPINTDVQHNQPHTVRTTANAVEWVSPNDCHGATMAKTTQAIAASPTTVRCGVNGSDFAISLACLVEGS